MGLQALFLGHPVMHHLLFCLLRHVQRHAGHSQLRCAPTAQRFHSAVAPSSLSHGPERICMHARSSTVPASQQNCFISHHSHRACLQT